MTSLPAKYTYRAKDFPDAKPAILHDLEQEFSHLALAAPPAGNFTRDDIARLIEEVADDFSTVQIHLLEAQRTRSAIRADYRRAFEQLVKVHYSELVSLSSLLLSFLY